tara:strand:+ start:90 stop:512 length:423 start_codon:yes stop_codon:yes gene_type:complete
VKIYQKKILIKPQPRGAHIITNKVIDNLSEIKHIDKGLLYLYLEHTSASLTINENTDLKVRNDLENFLNKIAPENEPYFTHTCEGPDDMPAHIKSSILGNNLIIPITNGTLGLGKWQGIFFCEHRNIPRERIITATIMGV